MRPEESMSVEEAPRVPIARALGIVTSIYRERAFGFIQEIDTETSRFVHRSGFRVEDEFARVRPGSIVSYIPVQGPRGPQAVDVQLEDGQAVKALEDQDGGEGQLEGSAAVESSADPAEALRALVGMGPEGRAVVQYLAEQEEGCETTVADDVVRELGRQGLGWPRQFVISVFHDLRAKAAGVFVVGRRGHPSRFIWRRDPGPAARRVLAA